MLRHIPLESVALYGSLFLFGATPPPPRYVSRGVQFFFLIWEPPPNCRRQKDYMKPVPYWRPLNMGHHSTKCIRCDILAPRICGLLCYLAILEIVVCKFHGYKTWSLMWSFVSSNTVSYLLCTEIRFSRILLSDEMRRGALLRPYPEVSHTQLNCVGSFLRPKHMTSLDPLSKIYGMFCLKRKSFTNEPPLFRFWIFREIAVRQRRVVALPTKFL